MMVSDSMFGGGHGLEGETIDSGDDTGDREELGSDIPSWRYLSHSSASFSKGFLTEP